jgi:hypothetical protein
MITGLSIQTLTLSYGLLIHIQGNALKDTSASNFELQILQWVVVLLNYLCILFPYILELMDLGIASTFSLLIFPSPTPAEPSTDVVLTLP